MVWNHGIKKVCMSYEIKSRAKILIINAMKEMIKQKYNQCLFLLSTRIFKEFGIKHITSNYKQAISWENPGVL